MSHLFMAVTSLNTTRYFVVSTSDVAIAFVHLLYRACRRALDELNLMVVSRRDNVTADESLTRCLTYRNFGSFDVYIGHRALIHGKMLQSLPVSPSYCGVENLSAFVLTRDKVFNLCPFLMSCTCILLDKGSHGGLRTTILGMAVPPGASSLCELDILSGK